MGQVADEVLELQRKKADELHSISCDLSAKDPHAYDAILQGIRVSLGYYDGAEQIGGHGKIRKIQTIRKLFQLRRNADELQDTEQIYTDACIFAYELETAAVDYLKTVLDAEEPHRSEAAGLLLKEHEASVESLWNRMMYVQSDLPGSQEYSLSEEQVREQEELRARTLSHFRRVREYSDEVDANMLSMELDQIRRLRAKGEITGPAARELRDQIYLLQTVYLE